MTISPRTASGAALSRASNASHLHGKGQSTGLDRPDPVNMRKSCRLLMKTGEFQEEVLCRGVSAVSPDNQHAGCWAALGNSHQDTTQKRYARRRFGGEPHEQAQGYGRPSTGTLKGLTRSCIPETRERMYAPERAWCSTLYAINSWGILSPWTADDEGSFEREPIA